MDSMKDSTLEQFARLRQQLAQERDSIVSRLAAIREVLGGGGATRSTASSASRSTRFSRKAAYTPREGSLPAKILAALGKAESAMQVKDIAAAVKKSPALVSQACVLLKRKGGLKRKGRGAYALP
jgi:hypothetical protein